MRNFTFLGNQRPKRYNGLSNQRKKATMPFTPTPYTPPDFTLPHLVAAPDVTLVPAPKDFVAPEATTPCPFIRSI